MSALHIFTSGHQPATNFYDENPTTGKRFRIRLRPYALRHCYGCDRRRRVENLTVQVFYDGLRYWCKDGCKPKSR
jgi:hypothetical protein